MNMVVSVPVGLLAGAAFRSMSWEKVMVIGLSNSWGSKVFDGCPVSVRLSK